MKSLMRALSEYYIVDLGYETRKGHIENAMEGIHNGGYAPFGYDVAERKYVINELETFFVRKMYDCALQKEGFRALLDEMKAAGIKGKRGKVMSYPSVYEILRNERYTGTYVYAPTVLKEERRTRQSAIRKEGAINTWICWEKISTKKPSRRYPLRS